MRIKEPNIKMTSEEFNNLSKEEFQKMSEEDFLKHLVRFSEERYIWYGKQLEWIYKDKEIWPPDDEFTKWYKAWIKELESSEQKWLRTNREELTYLRQGLNPPFCYPYGKHKVE